VGDREILETYLNSASKNTSETDLFPHGTKSLLTSVIGVTKYDNIETLWEKHVACMREMIVVGHHEGKKDIGDLPVEGRILLN
jgi:hypothetical protein